MAFYNHALEASIHGRKVLASLGIPITRPHDYFCENIKSDAHMSRVNTFKYKTILSFVIYLLLFIS